MAPDLWAHCHGPHAFAFAWRRVPRVHRCHEYWRCDAAGALADAPPPPADSAAGAKSPTDTTTSAREKASMRQGAEQFKYQAEVNRLLDILIHSLYSNKVCH